MDPVALASVLVSLVAAGSAWASQRSANKATTNRTNISVEAKRLEQAYERARKFDIETINRQDAEIEVLRREVHEVKEENEELQAQVLALQIQLGRTQGG